jgi:hypothetical protein
MNKETSNILAMEYVRIRNAASREYKEAFKKIGARMWNADKCHLLKRKNRDFIELQMQGFDYDAIKSVYGYVGKPLTVMDSYPEAHKFRAQLQRDIDKIYEKYQMEWDEILLKYRK